MSHYAVKTSFYDLFVLSSLLYYVHDKQLGGNSQKFLRKFVRFFLTLGLKILRLFRLKVLFEASTASLGVMLTTVQVTKYLFSMNNYTVKAP
jgi:hypothetical protein